MFNYWKVNSDIIGKLPEKIGQKVAEKREVDIEQSKTKEFIIEKKLNRIKRYFETEYLGTHLLDSILDFIKTEGTKSIVDSEEFKEMVLISATGLLLKEVRHAKEIKKVNLMLFETLGTRIGESPCKNIFLDKNSFIQPNRSITRNESLKETLGILKELSITKNEYLSALEKCVSCKEETDGLWKDTLQSRAFLEIEKKNCDITSQFDFVVYKEAADEFLQKKNNIYMAAEMYKLLIIAGYPLDEDRKSILTAYTGGKNGKDEKAAMETAKKLGLLPCKNIFEKIIYKKRK